MSQSRVHSLAEASLNTASGFALSLAAGQFLFPLFGVTLSVAQNFAVTGLMTVISVARSYAWRRAFNWLHARSGR